MDLPERMRDIKGNHPYIFNLLPPITGDKYSLQADICFLEATYEELVDFLNLLGPDSSLITVQTAMNAYRLGKSKAQTVVKEKIIYKHAEPLPEVYPGSGYQRPYGDWDDGYDPAYPPNHQGF